MRANTSLRIPLGFTAALVVLVMGLALAQDRDREPPPAREGGIPRDLAPQGAAKEGLEEGAPDVAAEPKLKEIAPRWIAPGGSWKLGVWAYSTESGVVITRVSEGSAAARQGLEAGDKIVNVGGYQVGFVGDLLYPLGFELQRQAGSRGQVLLLVQNVRNRDLQTMSVQLDRPGRVRPLPQPLREE
jgi:hypothetical protein